ncbi:ras-related protein Rab-15-like [Salvelinus sp. IW2-2015]|uniref:ras-related protein Rab-15-like n=1 Tax=Salvelinus sp. IW2-2015 TaxID=2691554 RepID=UPI000CEAE0AE|nr:ras-related protein Rab-15-like [Salvelinus alpinus]
MEGQPGLTCQADSPALERPAESRRCQARSSSMERPSQTDSSGQTAHGGPARLMSGQSSSRRGPAMTCRHEPGAAAWRPSQRLSYAPDNIQKILIGNKSDEEEKRQVATEQGNKLAKDYGMDFFETSAFTNHNITESFTRLAEQVLSANKKDLDLLRASVTDELNLAALEEEEGITDGPAASQKGCWC